MESEPTANSADFDAIFPDLTSFLTWNVVGFFRGQLRMASNVTRKQHVMRREIFDLPCASIQSLQREFKACSETPSTVEGEFSLQSLQLTAFYFVMTSGHLGLRIKRSCLRIFMELLAKNSVFDFPEVVLLHRSAIDCSVQLKIFVRRSQNLIKSHSCFRQQKISFKEAKIHLYDWGLRHTPSHTNVCKFFNFQLTFSQLILHLKC